MNESFSAEGIRGALSRKPNWSVDEIVREFSPDLESEIRNTLSRKPNWSVEEIVDGFLSQSPNPITEETLNTIYKDPSNQPSPHSMLGLRRVQRRAIGGRFMIGGERL
jgi:hypothetical protein